MDLGGREWGYNKKIFSIKLNEGKEVVNIFLVFFVDVVIFISECFRSFYGVFGDVVYI